MSEAHLEEPLLRAEGIDATEVYPVIQMIRRDVMYYIDTPLTYEAMTAPDLTYTLIQPLENKYKLLQRRGNMSVVFCLLLNRVYFIRDGHLTTAPLSRTRAALCEILAIRALREHGGNMLELALAVTTSWPVYSGAPQELLDRVREETDDDEIDARVGNSIEMAILSKAKRFIKSSACQKVIDGIWSGKIVYQADSSHSILSDTYKRNPIHLYDPHKAPLLDHYRLKVPAIRSVLEYINFLVLFILFVFALEFNERDRINFVEGLFMIYALGFTLEKIAAMQEHGIRVYFNGTWNGFDIAFVTLYCTYAVMRLVGVYNDKLLARNMGIDCLALIAVLVFPRLAFVTLKNNVMVLALRAMIAQFVALMLIAAFCFGGFLYALWTLGRGGARYSAGTIAWWMLDLWFGLDASGFENSTRFHPTFGPFLMITYACLSNTLLLTILVSILSNTFAKINDDAVAEAMFRRAVSTIEGVKADSLFSYQPPINLIALCIMLPASYILTPRWFHKLNVFMIRVTSFPVLIVVALYERQAKRSGTFTFYETISSAAEKLFDTLPRGLKRLSLFEGLSGPSAEIDTIFELTNELEESALDTGDLDLLQRLDPGHQPRPSLLSASPKLGRRVSNISNLSRSSHAQSSSAPKYEQHPGPSSSVPAPRQRLTSLVTRGVEGAPSATSPLAQIFQPLIFDDDVHDDQHLHENHGVSYGPATRRRMSSVQWRNHPTSDHPIAGSQSTALRHFPTQGSHESRTKAMSAQQPLSESPDSRTQPIETAEQIEEEGSLPLGKRLGAIEDRQRRIEDLLVQISDRMG